MGRSIVLPANVASAPVTALIHKMVDIWRFNNSTVNEYFLMKLYYSVILLGCVEILHFYPVVSMVYFFPGHSVVLQAHTYHCTTHTKAG